MLKLLRNSVYFNIVIDALHDSLTELGIEHKVVAEIDASDDATYVICTTHENRPLPKHYISYNFEQLTTDKRWDPLFFDRLRKAKYVLDYSLENIEVLKKYGISASYLPLGYSKSMEPPSLIEDTVKDIDFVFTGCLNDARMKKLRPLLDMYYKTPERIMVSNSCWGKDLIHTYKKSKIGLNLHFYGGKTILEVHRIIPMIVNRVWVLSEHSNDRWYDTAFSNLVTFVDKSSLVKQSMKVLKLTEEERSHILDDRYIQLITNYRYIDYVKKVKDMFIS